MPATKLIAPGRWLAFNVVAADFRASSAADISRLAAEAKPGDVLVLADGAWTDQAILFGAKGTAVELDAGIGTSRRTLRPENITLANNLFSVSEGALLKGAEGAGCKWMGNLAWPAGVKHAGIKFADAKLERGPDGLWRPGQDSAARGAAEGNFPSIRTDIDGPPRPARPDVGCDQNSDAPVARRPLTSADVGLAWRNRTDVR